MLMNSHQSKTIRPDPVQSRLVQEVEGRDERGRPVSVPVVREEPLTIYLNGQEIVTTMTVGDLPDYLAVGFLRNQNMLTPDDEITSIEHDDELGVVVVRTSRATNYERKLKKKVQTSGCAQGTVFGDLMEEIDKIILETETRLNVADLGVLLKEINTMPSLYLSAGAIHGCVLAKEDSILAYIEDVGRHNAVDKIAGWMMLNNVSGHDKTLYTTGRLTSEMILKTVQMQIPILISRSGFTLSGVEIARKTGLTLIGRARGKRFTVLSGEGRIRDDTPYANNEVHTDETHTDASSPESISPQRRMR